MRGFTSIEIAEAMESGPESAYMGEEVRAAGILRVAVLELTEALEDAITGCANPRQKPGEVLAKYKEALDD